MWIKENQIRVELCWWPLSSKGEGRWPQAVPEVTQVGHQQEFLPGKGGQGCPGSDGVIVPGDIQKMNKCSTQCSGHAGIWLKGGLGNLGGLFQPW